MEQQQTQKEQPTQILKKISAPKENLLLIAILAIGVVLAGVGSGWVLSQRKAGGSESGSKTVVSNGEVKEAGLTDESVFKDTAEGVLEEGGINGEGTHHLVRDGGPSRYVYLSSTVIDLGGFVGKKVQVWGETIGGKKAGWLIDVGRIKVLE